MIKLYHTIIYQLNIITNIFISYLNKFKNFHTIKTQFFYFYLSQ